MLPAATNAILAVVRRHGGQIATGLTTLCAVTLGGCFLQPVGDSCPVATNEVSMAAFVVDNGTSIRAVADFQEGEHGNLGSPRLELCEDDVLTINGEAVTESFKSDRVEYSVSWDPGEAPTEFEFVLDRKEHDGMTARVTLPPPFEITSPPAMSMVPRTQDVDFTWDPPLDMAEIQISLDDEIGEPCRISPTGPPLAAGILVPDTGVYTLLANTIDWESDPAYNPTLQTTCDSWVQLARTLEGEYPAQLEPSGVIEARVERRVDFVSVP